MRFNKPKTAFAAPARRLCAASLLVGPLLLASSGCSSSREQYVQFLRSYEHVVSSGDYRVAPPDTVSIAAPIAPEIDGVTTRVRPDGKIALRLLGEVYIAGLTTTEVADKIETLLQRYYVEPEVVVDVVGFESQHYYIFGEVGSPGPKPYTGRDTLMKALARAQPNNFAWRERIRVTRPSPESDERISVIVNLNDLVKDGDLSRNFLLQPGDVVHVPPTPIAWVGHQVRALLYPVSPVLEAYETPADFLEARDTYRDYRDDGDDNRGLGLGALRP
jgi:polysaccharide export outer membrane protein